MVLRLVEFEPTSKESWETPTVRVALSIAASSMASFVTLSPGGRRDRRDLDRAFEVGAVGGGECRGFWEVVGVGDGVGPATLLLLLRVGVRAAVPSVLTSSAVRRGGNGQPPSLP
ncbi:hypothetical protein GCM10020220_040500 [Nonomuraea rubra]